MTEQTSYAYGYARMPRVIRKGYKNLTKLQKLLYIYLRDLAGEDGTCYRSLRTLQEETEFSIGYLSENIPILHNEGLIHAEMKSSPSTHWQVWHITIVDIWEKNAAFLQSEKCSPDEQLIDKSVHRVNSSVHAVNSSDESVHTVNESVHAVILNKNPIENHITENNNREEREEVADATAPAQIHISEVSQDNEEDTKKRRAFMAKVHKIVAQANNGTRTPATKVTIPKRPTQKPITMEPVIPEKALVILDRWDSIHGKPAPRTPKAIQAAQLLTVCDPSAEDLKKCQDWLYTTDRPGKPWYRSHGVHLPDIAENIGKWQSLQEAPPQTSAVNGHSPPGSNGAKPRPSALVSEEQSAKNKARLYAAAAAKQAEKAGQHEN